MKHRQHGNGSGKRRGGAALHDADMNGTSTVFFRVVCVRDAHLAPRAKAVEGYRTPRREAFSAARLFHQAVQPDQASGVLPRPRPGPPEVYSAWRERRGEGQSPNTQRCDNRELGIGVPLTPALSPCDVFTVRIKHGARGNMLASRGAVAPWGWVARCDGRRQSRQTRPPQPTQTRGAALSSLAPSLPLPADLPGWGEGRGEGRKY
jgi:hypothetical protein